MADSSLEPAYSQCTAIVGAAVFKYGYLSTLGVVGAHLALDATCHSTNTHSLTHSLHQPTHRTADMTVSARRLAVLAVCCCSALCSSSVSEVHESHSAFRYRMQSASSHSASNSQHSAAAPRCSNSHPTSMQCGSLVCAALVAFVSWVGGYRAKRVCWSRIAEQEQLELSKRRELQCPKGTPHLYLVHNPPLHLAPQGRTTQ